MISNWFIGKFCVRTGFHTRFFVGGEESIINDSVWSTLPLGGSGGVLPPGNLHVGPLEVDSGASEGWYIYSRPFVVSLTKHHTKFQDFWGGGGIPGPPPPPLYETLP